MRELITHKGPTNYPLTVTVVDEPGPGGAHHHYVIDTLDGKALGEVKFQKGPLKESRVNGVTHEALLAIVADRLVSFQKGPFACIENEQALANVQKALSILHGRTLSRANRGVEGTHNL
jgi:hypothetical protein